ncbi:trypsin-like serine protease [Streptomyces sp. NPDC047985]|uniref:trypsin-like serine peptidase n=1 Tax=unclassified Streptomyces TaxID=2593676 RepID=UPI0034311B7E
MTTHTKSPTVSRTRSTLLLGVLAAASLAIGGLTAVPACAQGPDGPARTNVSTSTSTSTGTGAGARLASTEHATGVDTPAEARKVEQFHAKARLPKATAADQARWLPRPDTAASAHTRAQAPTGAPGSIPPAAPAASARQWAKGLPKAVVKGVEKEFGRELADGLPLIRTVGKIEYTNPRDPGKTYQCSGASINSPSKMMVATAGHCVAIGGSGHGGGDPSDRVWMENWVFMPAYNTGGQEAPYGKFTAKYFRAFDYWLDGGGRPYDFALVTVNLNERGQRVVDAVGGNGLSWNYTFHEDLLMVGYPLNHGAGYTQDQFAGRTTTSTVNSAMIMMEAAGFNEGGSGGPWLRMYDPVTGLGKINGVTSYIHNGTSNNNDSPHFDGGMKWLWDEQGSRT